MAATFFLATFFLLLSFFAGVLFFVIAGLAGSVRVDVAERVQFVATRIMVGDRGLAGLDACLTSEHPAPSAHWLHNDPGGHDCTDPLTAFAYVAACSESRVLPVPPEPVSVTTGITDGNYTEITDGEIKPGDKLIKHYLQFTDLTADEYTYLFERAAIIKKKFKAYENGEDAAQGPGR